MNSDRGECMFPKQRNSAQGAKILDQGPDGSVRQFLFYQEMYPSSFFRCNYPPQQRKKFARNNTRFWGPKRQKKRKILQKKFPPVEAFV